MRVGDPPVGGRYSLVESFGADERFAGGKVQTWRAHDSLVDRAVVLRVMTPGGNSAKLFLDRALEMSLIAHPGLGMVYDAVDLGEHALVVCEWIDGTSLADTLKAHGPLTPTTARQTLGDVAEAITVAHHAGLPIGGITAERVILRDNGSVTVTGVPALFADERGDIQQLGTLLYAALTGEEPAADDPDLAKKLHRGVPRDLAVLCQRALDTDPARQLGSAAAFAAVLRPRTKQRSPTGATAGRAGDRIGGLDGVQSAPASETVIARQPRTNQAAVPSPSAPPTVVPTAPTPARAPATVRIPVDGSDARTAKATQAAQSGASGPVQAVATAPAVPPAQATATVEAPTHIPPPTTSPPPAATAPPATAPPARDAKTPSTNPADGSKPPPTNPARDGKAPPTNLATDGTAPPTIPAAAAKAPPANGAAGTKVSDTNPAADTKVPDTNPAAGTKVPDTNPAGATKAPPTQAITTRPRESDPAPASAANRGPSLFTPNQAPLPAQSPPPQATQPPQAMPQSQPPAAAQPPASTTPRSGPTRPSTWGTRPDALAPGPAAPVSPPRTADAVGPEPVPSTQPTPAAAEIRSAAASAPPATQAISTSRAPATERKSAPAADPLRDDWAVESSSRSAPDVRSESPIRTTEDYDPWAEDTGTWGTYDDVDDGDDEDFEEGSPTRRKVLMYAVPLLALILVVVMAVVVGKQLADVVNPEGPAVVPDSESTSDGPSPSEGETPADPSAAAPLSFAGAAVYNPFGDGGSEHDEDVGLSADGDPATAWTTLTYESTPEFGNLKDGVGVMFDLGAEHTINAVELSTTLPGSSVQVRVGMEPGGSLDSYPMVGALDPFDATGSVPLAEPVQGRFVLIWFVRLVEADDGFQAALAECRVVGV